MEINSDDIENDPILEYAVSALKNRAHTYALGLIVMPPQGDSLLWHNKANDIPIDVYGYKHIVLVADVIFVGMPIYATHWVEIRCHYPRSKAKTEVTLTWQMDIISQLTQYGEW